MNTQVCMIDTNVQVSSTMHLNFVKESNSTTYMIHITLKKLKFQKTCKTFTTFKIHEQVGLDSKRKFKYVRNFFMNIDIGEEHGL